VTEAHVCEQLA